PAPPDWRHRAAPADGSIPGRARHPVFTSGSVHDINNPTGTKQPVTPESGIVGWSGLPLTGGVANSLDVGAEDVPDVGVIPTLSHLDVGQTRSTGGRQSFVVRPLRAVVHRDREHSEQVETAC